ncbi:MAG: hypothetical protein LBS50_01375 [Prevotellaceae bacterium]|jgi:hypothetical protein|nr:hypothetical protein [Prevotellaceae bacterium]
MGKWRFKVMPRGRNFAVYEMVPWQTERGSGESGTKIAEFYTYEKARDEAYKMNKKYFEKTVQN